MKPCVKCGASDRNKWGQCRPCRAKWRAENPEKRKTYDTKYCAANPEKVKAIHAKWYAKNSEGEKGRAAKRYAVNSEKIKIRSAKWRKANLKSSCVCQHNYRARKQANGGKLSKGLSKALYARQKGRCACCKKLLGDNYHLDHIVPLALGGANEDWNIQLLTATCNLNKGAKHPIDYMRSKGLLL